jgi:hypothetical protein
MTPIFFDPHVCQPPSTADLIGREMDFECGCGRRCRLEHSFGEDGSLPRAGNGWGQVNPRIRCWLRPHSSRR